MALPIIGALMGGGIPWKLIGYLGLAAAIIIPIGLHIWGDVKMERKLESKNTEISTLRTEKQQLKDSNASLNLTIVRKDAEMETVTREIERFRETERELNQELTDFREEIESEERKSRIDKIIAGRKASLLLRMANTQAECQWRNFDRFDGECIAGKFVLEGERLVPLEEEES